MWTENFNKKKKFFPVKHKLKIYSVKSYEITLMHFLTIFIFAHFVEIQRAFFFFFLTMAKDREIIQKNQRPGPNPDDIKTISLYIMLSEFLHFILWTKNID